MSDAEFETWLIKFEQLLRDMSWLSVDVFIETEGQSSLSRYWWVTQRYDGGASSVWERGVDRFRSISTPS
ncbi:MAG: hypothetical protein AAFP18_00915 [Bacteroidota bacterium]